MTRALSQSRTLPRRGLSRDEAAAYLGVSPSTFDTLRDAGKVEPPRLIGARKLWDIRELDLAFDALPREDSPATGSSWDDA
jgi:hypothetical protein